MTEAYITVLTNDRYLPGALVLGNALKDLGTTRKLAILVANVSTDAIQILKTVYDDIINVSPILSTSLAELADLEDQNSLPRIPRILFGPKFNTQRSFTSILTCYQWCLLTLYSTRRSLTCSPFRPRQMLAGQISSIPVSSSRNPPRRYSMLCLK